MRKFLIQLLLFSIPFVFYGLIVVYVNINDPFKVFGNYTTFYEESIVDLNRENVCLQLFKNNSKNTKYDSFIFGSSRSLAFKIPQWKKHLPESTNGFHFDATGESVFGIYNKLKYLKDKNVTIKNALLILDNNTFENSQNRKGHLSISPPELTNESQLDYYKEYIYSTANCNFVIEYLDYKFNNNVENNSFIFLPSKYNNKSDNKTGDFYFGTDKIIENNQEKYYQSLLDNGVFYKRDKQSNFEDSKIKKNEIMYLKKIARIFLNDATHYKIVISPLYNQKKFSPKRLQLLSILFKKENIYDFSGKNQFTNSIYNYYETSHYRPKVANQIMNIIY